MEILPIIEFLCFFAAPFSPKTLLEEKGQTVEFAGKTLRIKRSRKQRDRCWPLTGHRIIFCAQSQTSIHISQVTALLRVTSQRLSFPFLKTFPAPFPDPTDCPLVSEDERVADGQVKSESAPYGNERILPVVYKTKTTKHNNVYA